MPVSEGGRYRMVTTKTGKKIRLHFKKSGGVDEAKNLESGETHTPKEFMNDKIRGKRSARSK